MRAGRGVAMGDGEKMGVVKLLYLMLLQHRGTKGAALKL